MSRWVMPAHKLPKNRLLKKTETKIKIFSFRKKKYALPYQGFGLYERKKTMCCCSLGIATFCWENSMFFYFDSGWWESSVIVSSTSNLIYLWWGSVTNYSQKLFLQCIFLRLFSFIWVQFYCGLWTSSTALASLFSTPLENLSTQPLNAFLFFQSSFTGMVVFTIHLPCLS